MTDLGEKTARVGISACLLGECVRYDGGHKRQHLLAEGVAEWIQWVSHCPEASAGLGIPRPPMRLFQGSPPRLRVVESGKDLSASMGTAVNAQVSDLQVQHLDGFVLKSRSPSCGMGSTPIHDEQGRAVEAGSGLFAEALSTKSANLPLAEETELLSADGCHRFFTRIFARRRWRSWLEGGERESLAQFHQRHRRQLAVHGLEALETLDDLAASEPRESLGSRYGGLFAQSLRQNVSRVEHGLALRSVASRLGDLPALGRAIDDYEDGRTPLVAILLLMGKQARAQGAEDLAGQTYLEPYPHGLMLRVEVLATRP